MASQNFQYTKISELPATTQLVNADVFIVNHGGETCKITFQNLMAIIDSLVTHDVSALTQRVSTLESAVSDLGTRTTTLEGTVADNSGTISNIITAGFNLIGVE